MNRLLLLLAISSFFVTELPGRPNVLFLAVDDMNDWIGPHQTTPVAVTPNLDRLAARGVNFTNAHTAGVFCAPSRAAIFSGQYASTTGCYDTALYFVDHPELQPLQMAFARRGYQTMGAGKLFHHPAGAVDLRGWDEFFVRNRSQRETGYPLDSWSEEVPFPDPKPHGIYHRTPGAPPTNAGFMDYGPVPDDRENELADTIRADWAVRRLRELAEQESDQPFFLAVGFYAPHFPNYCPQKYFDLYQRDEIALPPYLDSDPLKDLADLPEAIRNQKTNRARIHQRLVEVGGLTEALHGYLACISYADAMVGRVLDALDASGLADDTVVVLWSDHGYHHGEKGDWGKHTLWERTSNVPFLWAGPGVAQGKDCTATVSLIDIYPTLLELCQLDPAPQPLEGTSLASTLADPDTAADRSVYLPHMRPESYAIINRDWRYIRYENGSEELYDVRADPNEWTNLAPLPKHAGKLNELSALGPKSFAKPAPKRNAKRHMRTDGETFHWIREVGVPKESKSGRPAGSK